MLEPALRTRLARLPAWAADGLSATLAAQAFVLPLQMATFHYLSPLSPLMNLLVVPLLPPLMALGLLVALVGPVAPGLAAMLALVPWAYLELIVRVVETGARLPGARLETGALPPLLGVLYCVALIGVALAASPEAPRLRAALARVAVSRVTRPAAGIAALTLALTVLVSAGRSDARLHVAVLDVGQGDATLIRTPSGRLALVDGGPNPAALLAHLGSRLGPGERHFHLVALTHPHEDHVAGLVDVVQRYEVGQVVEGAVDYVSAGAERWRRRLGERGVAAVAGASGQQWQLDEGVTLDVWASCPTPHLNWPG
jgi:competence protein ComEC